MNTSHMFDPFQFIPKQSTFPKHSNMHSDFDLTLVITELGLSVAQSPLTGEFPLSKEIEIPLLCMLNDFNMGMAPDVRNISGVTRNTRTDINIVCELSIACFDDADVSALGMNIGRSPVQATSETNFSI